MFKRFFFTGAALIFFVPCVSFGQITILGAYQKALEHDYVLQSARHAFKATEAAKWQTTSQLLPSITGSIKETHYDTDRYDTYETKEQSLSFVQPIFDLGKYYQWRQSDYTVISAKAKLDATQMDVMVRVVGAYLNVLFAQDNIGLLKSKLEGASEQLTQAEKMFKAGQFTITNVHDAQANYDMVRYELINTENNLLVNTAELESMIGPVEGPLACIGAGFNFAGHDISTLSDWLNMALDNSRDIEYYRSAAVTADYTVKVNRAQYLPTANFVMGYLKTDSVNNIKSTETTYKSISAQVNIPIFRSGYNMSRVKESKERFYQSVSDLNQTVVTVRKNVTETYTYLSGLKSKISALEKAAASNSLAFDSNKKSFKAGVVTLVDVIDAQNKLYDSLVQLTRAKYEYFNNYIKLKYLAGNISESDVSFLDSLVNEKCKEIM